MNNTITVVVPVYNMEQYLEKCIESLLNQTISNYEIILVDDGSTDNSLMMCNNYAQKYSNRIRCIHKDNGGLSSARNAGIKEARGNYIVFPDPDDWVEENYLEVLWTLANEYPDKLPCTGYRVEFNDKSISQYKDKTILVWERCDSLLHLLVQPCFKGFAWNKLFNINIIRDNQLAFSYDTGNKEDLDFAFNYLTCSECRGVVFSCFSETYHYYQRQGAATHSGVTINRYKSINAYKKMLNANGLENRFINEVKTCICKSALNMLVDYYGTNQNNAEICNGLINYINKYKKYYLKNKHISFVSKIKLSFALISPKLLKVLY